VSHMFFRSLATYYLVCSCVNSVVIVPDTQFSSCLPCLAVITCFQYYLVKVHKVLVKLTPNLDMSPKCCMYYSKFQVAFFFRMNTCMESHLWMWVLSGLHIWYKQHVVVDSENKKNDVCWHTYGFKNIYCMCVGGSYNLF